MFSLQYTVKSLIIIQRNLHYISSAYLKSLPFNSVHNYRFIRRKITTENSNTMIQRIPFSSDFFFRQLFDKESCTYTYLLADIKSNEAVIIDPVLELAKRDAQLVRDLGLKVKYVMNTHMHADHITGTGWLKQLLPDCKSVISKSSGAKADIYLNEGDKLKFGSNIIDTLSTPGHTNGCFTYVVHQQGCVFTGDTLLIRGCGRTDFQEGNSRILYENIHNKIFSLPLNYRIYPAHDYNGQLESTVWEEKHFNPRLTKTLSEFVQLMENLNLPYPKKIDKALPANRECGVYDIPDQHFLEINDKECVDLQCTDVNDQANLISNATVGRRRKSASNLNGIFSCRSNGNEFEELRSALQERESVIENLRIQLCLGKLPQPIGPPLDEFEKSAAEQKLQQLKTDTENKKIQIHNLKIALDNLDITDNIDSRIRQAELEYSLGREELQLLSFVGEMRFLQARLDKSQIGTQSLYRMLLSGVIYNLYAVQATMGRWSAQTSIETPGIFYIQWALEGNGLYKGDRILEINGYIVYCKTKEEFQKLIGNTGKCKMVVLRRKSPPITQKQIDQEKENNLRLQHRISYLEEQVRELQANNKHENNITIKTQQEEQNYMHMSCATSGHVTSISISAPPTHITSTTTDKPTIFQRGNYITTLVGGKPIELLGEEEHTELEHKGNLLGKSKSTAHITKTLIGENNLSNINVMIPTHQQQPSTYSTSIFPINYKSPSIWQLTKVDHKSVKKNQQYINHEFKCCDKTINGYKQSTCQRPMMGYNIEHNNPYSNGQIQGRFDILDTGVRLPHLSSSDKRSVKSMDCNSDNEMIKTKLRSNINTAKSEVRSLRPTPPKKPLRLSLQRAQSLQTVELNMMTESERKRALKRSHISEKLSKTNDKERGSHILIENCTPAINSLHISSLGRQPQLI